MAAAKGTRTCLWSKKFDFKTQGATESITLNPLVVPLLHSGVTAQVLLILNSKNPYKYASTPT